MLVGRLDHLRSRFGAHAACLSLQVACVYPLAADRQTPPTNLRQPVATHGYGHPLRPVRCLGAGRRHWSRSCRRPRRSMKRDDRNRRAHDSHQGPRDIARPRRVDPGTADRQDGGPAGRLMNRWPRRLWPTPAGPTMKQARAWLAGRWTRAKVDRPEAERLKADDEGSADHPMAPCRSSHSAGSRSSPLSVWQGTEGGIVSLRSITTGNREWCSGPSLASPSASGSLAKRCLPTRWIPAQEIWMLPQRAQCPVSFCHG